MDEWYKIWFDSPFYHILYHERDEKEARQFLTALIDFLRPSVHALMLDQACGRGRHARILAEMGFQVTGIDLSENNIAYCKQFENDHLHFAIHDMRRILAVNMFDYAFNLFTSMGYFRNENDQQLTISSAAAALKKGGYYIIDFMNAKRVIRELIPEMYKSVNDIDFRIRRRVEDHFIIKEIEFEHQGQPYHFTEYVQAMTLDDFESYFARAGLTLCNTFGDYHLHPFDEHHSERLILIARKNLD
jgi:SAM-dependent methyltransferase